MSIQCPWRNSCGEHLNAAQLHLHYHLVYDRKPGQGSMHLPRIRENPETMPHDIRLFERNLC
jgi:hypothetical protein